MYVCVSVFVCSDLLFNQLYTQLVENMVAKGVFLESLESYIVADHLGYLPTPIMKDLLSHYRSSGMMDSLERCIVHLDITSLDIQQVCLVLCTIRNVYLSNNAAHSGQQQSEKEFSSIK